MAKVETFACDICGAQKGGANHWWLIFLVEGGLLVLDWEFSGRPERSPFTADAHLCGQVHLLEWMSKNFLTKES